MARLDHEPEDTGGIGIGWIWGVVATIAVVLVVWWAWPGMPPNHEVARVSDIQPVEPAATQAPGPAAAGRGAPSSDTAPAPGAAAADGQEGRGSGTADAAGPTVSSPDLAAIVDNPDQYVGQTFQGDRIRVSQVPGSRSFWIAAPGGRNLFAVIEERTAEELPRIAPGAIIGIRRATLRHADYLSQMPPGSLDDATRYIAEHRDVFLVVDAGAITVEQPGTPSPATGG